MDFGDKIRSHTFHHPKWFQESEEWKIFEEGVADVWTPASLFSYWEAVGMAGLIQTGQAVSFQSGLSSVLTVLP